MPLDYITGQKIFVNAAAAIILILAVAMFNSQLANESDRVDENGIFAQITDFGDDSILIKTSAYVKTTDYLEYLKISEELNLKIMDVLQTWVCNSHCPANLC